MRLKPPQHKIEVKLNRDQAYHIHNAWLRYMLLLSETRMINNADNTSKYLNSMMICDLIDQVDDMFDAKLKNRNVVTFTFKLTPSQAAVFYFHLHTHPLDQSTSVWEKQLRQRLCDGLYEQLTAMRPFVADPPPITEVDFLMHLME